MDGKEIMNSFKRETFYEFSEAVPVFNDKIYFIFKVDIISISINPFKTKIENLKKLMNNKLRKHIKSIAAGDTATSHSTLHS